MSDDVTAVMSYSANVLTLVERLTSMVRILVGVYRIHPRRTTVFYIPRKQRTFSFECIAPPNQLAPALYRNQRLR